ncbi:apolipoprotein L domain-containing protein 1-like isoform X2 [Onychostoma macrolepis]|nr:apolipoprotein L domain-containing protein 1-like isoform X2 [Onychostoma macrolepis]
MHKNTTVGSLTGATMGAAGGIASIVGLALAPVTLGVSLGLTAVGGVLGVAGGATGAICNYRNNTEQKRLRETIEEITSDFQNTINAMLEILRTIINSTEDIQQLVQQDMNHIPARMMEGGVDRVRGVSAILELPKAEMPQKSEAAKQFDEAVYWTKAARTAFQSCPGAVKKISSSSETVKNINLTSKVAKTMRLSSEKVRIVSVSAKTAKAVRSAAAVSGVISALFVVVDVYCIVQNSMEIHEMNQSVGKRTAKNIKSDDLKFIHQMRETAANFQKTLNEIKDARDTAIIEFNRELKNGTSFLVRQKHRGNYNALLRIVLISIILVFLICRFLD